MKSGRRSILKALVGLPVVGGVFGSAVSGFHRPIALEDDQDRFMKKSLAINVLRVINTAEHWHLRETGTFAELTSLQESRQVMLFLDGCFKDGGSLLASLSLNKRQFISGWVSSFKFTGRKSGYLAALGAEDEELGAFATDNTGVIFEGIDLVKQVATDARAAQSLLVAASPIGTHGTKAQRVGHFFRKVALGAVPQLWCCGGCCRCNLCCPDPKGSCTTNCGCVPCTWCFTK